MDPSPNTKDDSFARSSRKLTDHEAQPTTVHQLERSRKFSVRSQIQEQYLKSTTEDNTQMRERKRPSVEGCDYPPLKRSRPMQDGNTKAQKSTPKPTQIVPYDESTAASKDLVKPNKSAISQVEKEHSQSKNATLLGLFCQFMEQYGDDAASGNHNSPCSPGSLALKKDASCQSPGSDLDTYMPQEQREPTPSIGQPASHVAGGSLVSMERGFARKQEDRNESFDSVFTDQELSGEITPVNHSGSHLCKNCLNSSHVAELLEKIHRLQKEVERLQKLEEPEPESIPRIQVFHLVKCNCSGQDGSFSRRTRTSTYLDPPHRMTGDRKWHLQGRLNAPDETVYLDQNPDVILLVYKYYECKHDAARFNWQGRPTITRIMPDNSPPLPSKESIDIISPTLLEPLTWATNDSQFIGKKPTIGLRAKVFSPYHFFYHNRHSISQKKSHMDEEHQQNLEILLDYVEESFESSYAEANILFANGQVSSESIYYLFEPGSYVVQDNSLQGDTIAFMADSWLEDNDSDLPSFEKLHIGELRCWAWRFDGSFLPIQSLPVYPLRYAQPGVEDKLYERGTKFWECRKRVYVSYDDESVFGDSVQRGSRYMVDVVMHRELNLQSQAQKTQEKQKNAQKQGIGKPIELASLSETPSREFFLLLPSVVYGYSMQTKRWVLLKAKFISPVIWNVEAFDNLVVDDDVKELVKALVTNKLAKEKATDLMDGKGNGLVILLHGGPGTGKTLTAESVAELAHKPLYRVSCGDIGTNADAIEQHLQRVLHLGRVWGCVVLLDEADVFLEERSLADMQRNALVSVFLRVLEYYDGILILTSNRVGTFDEAFKSRIQLALHYENLTRSQRRAIWANFLNRLEDIERENVNTENLREYLDVLANHDMNGRQIRNASTTARQLALYKEKKMDYSLLKHAINVGAKFDNYLKTVKYNISDDEFAREGGVR